jgi:aminoglycoside phosphotransferase
MATKKVASGKEAMKVAGIAAGIAGALAGSYLLYAHTKPQQKKAKAWVMKARKSAAAEAKKLSVVGEKEYHRVMEKALRHYGAVEKIGAPEIMSAIRDAKAEWKHIQGAVKKATKVVRPAKKKSAKKTIKKAARRK